MYIGNVQWDIFSENENCKRETNGILELTNTLSEI